MSFWWVFPRLLEPLFSIDIWPIRITVKLSLINYRRVSKVKSTSYRFIINMLTMNWSRRFLLSSGISWYFSFCIVSFPSLSISHLLSMTEAHRIDLCIMIMFMLSTRKNFIQWPVSICRSRNCTIKGRMTQFPLSQSNHVY